MELCASLCRLEILDGSHSNCLQYYVYFQNGAPHVKLRTGHQNALPITPSRAGLTQLNSLPNFPTLVSNPVMPATDLLTLEIAESLAPSLAAQRGRSRNTAATSLAGHRPLRLRGRKEVWTHLHAAHEPNGHPTRAHMCPQSETSKSHGLHLGAQD
jgi:hypothetical protein